MKVPLYRVGQTMRFLKEICAPLECLRPAPKWYGGVFHLKQLKISFVVFWTQIGASNYPEAKTANKFCHMGNLHT